MSRGGGGVEVAVAITGQEEIKLGTDLSVVTSAYVGTIIVTFTQSNTTKHGKGTQHHGEQRARTASSLLLCG